MRTSFIALLAALLTAGICGCKAGPDPAIQAEAKDSTKPQGEVAETAHSATSGLANASKQPGKEKGPQITFLEYIIIESQIRCVAKHLAADPAGSQAATLKVLAHHKINSTWLESTRKLAQDDGQKSSKTADLLEEARTTVCPSDKPNEELVAILAAEAPPPAAAPADSPASL